MNDFSIPMAIVDFLPVFLFGQAAFLAGVVALDKAGLKEFTFKTL